MSTLSSRAGMLFEKTDFMPTAPAAGAAAAAAACGGDVRNTCVQGAHHKLTSELIIW